MDDAFAREVTLRSLLKSKGYEFDQENQWWAREWTTNGGQEKVLEVCMKTEDGEWNKLMMTPDGFVFSAEAISKGVE
jgi:hypothetical protein